MTLEYIINILFDYKIIKGNLRARAHTHTYTDNNISLANEVHGVKAPAQLNLPTQYKSGVGSPSASLPSCSVNGHHSHYHAIVCASITTKLHFPAFSSLAACLSNGHSMRSSGNQSDSNLLILMVKYHENPSYQHYLLTQFSTSG